MWEVEGIDELRTFLWDHTLFMRSILVVVRVDLKRLLGRNWFSGTNYEYDRNSEPGKERRQQKLKFRRVAFAVENTRNIEPHLCVSPASIAGSARWRSVRLRHKVCSSGIASSL